MNWSEFLNTSLCFASIWAGVSLWVLASGVLSHEALRLRVYAWALGTFVLLTGAWPSGYDVIHQAALSVGGVVRTAAATVLATALGLAVAWYEVKRRREAARLDERRRIVQSLNGTAARNGAFRCGAHALR